MILRKHYMLLVNMHKSIEDIKNKQSEEAEKLDTVRLTQVAQTTKTEGIAAKVDALTDNLEDFLNNRSKTCPYNGSDIQSSRSNSYKIISAVISIGALVVAILSFVATALLK